MKWEHARLDCDGISVRRHSQMRAQAIPKSPCERYLVVMRSHIACLREIIRSKAVISRGVARQRRPENISKPVICKPRLGALQRQETVFHNPRKEGCMIICQQDMSGAVLQDSVIVVGSTTGPGRPK